MSTNIDNEIPPVMNDLTAPISVNNSSNEVPQSDLSATTQSSGDIINILYKNLPLEVAIAMSREERQKNGYNSTTLAYGEIEYSSFVEVV